jgi:hypothetical protein
MVISISGGDSGGLKLVECRDLRFILASPINIAISFEKTAD